jgi:hypothetical protein
VGVAGVLVEIHNDATLLFCEARCCDDALYAFSTLLVAVNHATGVRIRMKNLCNEESIHLNLTHAPAQTSLSPLDGSSQEQARFLLRIAHASTGCRLQDCRVVECAQTTALLQHIRSCALGDGCEYTRCAMAKRIVCHHRDCRDLECVLCLPLRQQMSAEKMGNAIKGLSLLNGS